MLDAFPGVGPFVTGAFVGLGQSLAQVLIRLTANRIAKASRAAPAASGSTATPERSNKEPVYDPSSDEGHLAQAVGQVRTEADWSNLVKGLRESGIPFDGHAARELAGLADEVLKKATAPPEAVGRLAKLTATAFQRAGIEVGDLARWESVSTRLIDDETPPASEKEGQPRCAVAVATAKRPGTWWVWNRAEVDRRLLRYVERNVEYCWTACNQAMATPRDVAALPQFRDLREQLALVRELIQTMTPLVPEKRRLRVEAWRERQLLSSSEQAVRATEALSSALNNLVASEAGTPEAREAFAACGKAVTLLVQTLRDRRAVR